MKENLENQNNENLQDKNVLIGSEEESQDSNTESNQESNKRHHLENDFLPEDNMEVIKELLENLMGLACHFGHPQTSSKAKKLSYVLYKLNGSNIINLDKTIENLRQSLKLIYNIVSKGEKILFLTTNQHLKELFKETALQCRAFYIITRYQPGTLTNHVHFFEKKRKLEESKVVEDETLTKKERKVLKNKRQHTEDYFEGLTGLNEIPKLIITVGGEKEDIVNEAKKMGVAVISFNDINVDPISGYNLITIPCNTKSVDAIRYIFQNHVAKIVLRGYEQFLNNNKRLLKEKSGFNGLNSSKNINTSPKKTIEDIEKKMKKDILGKVNNEAIKT
jgi:small subunit ribosomal protein S2